MQSIPGRRFVETRSVVGLSEGHHVGLSLCLRRVFMQMETTCSFKVRDQ